MAAIAEKIQKLVVYDSRMLQLPPRYAIERGALSTNPQRFRATTASSTAHTFTILPPYEDVMWSRYILWTCTTGLKIRMRVERGVTLHVPLLPAGLWSLAPFPNTQLVSTIQATFNNCSVTTQLSDTLDLQLRMCALAANNSLRFAPHKMDRYARYEDSIGASSATTASYDDAVDSTSVPNGAGANYWFCTATGAIAREGDVVATSGAYTISIRNGQPCTDQYAAADYEVDLYLAYTSIEPLWLSPLIFSDVMEGGAALTGIKSASVVLNMRTPSAAHLLRVANRQAWPITVQSVDWAPGSGAGGVGLAAQADSTLNIFFLSAPLSLPKAPACVLPYMDVPRYPTASGTDVRQHSYTALRYNLGLRPEDTNVVPIDSNIITLSQIPDFVAIFVRPRNDNYAFAPGIDAATQGRWLLPIKNISITFNNRSGLLAGATQFQLFEMTRANGIRDVDWNAFRGYGMTPQGRVGLAGSPVVLRATDWGIDDAFAPGLSGAWSFQVRVETYAPQSISPPGTGPLVEPPPIPVDVVIVPYMSGFMITREGETERIMGVLTSKEILSSASAPYIERSELARTVGAGLLSLTQHAPGRMMGWHAGAPPAATAAPAPAVTAGVRFAAGPASDASRTVGSGAPYDVDLPAAAAYARSYRPSLFADGFRDAADGKRRRYE